MGKELELELENMDNEERERILHVLQKDFLLKQVDEERIKRMKEDLYEKAKGVYQMEYEANNRQCFICKKAFLPLFRRGATCSICRYAVCNGCRSGRTLDETLCVICSQKKLYRSQSLYWFYNRVNSKFKNNASSKVIKSLCKRYKDDSISDVTIKSLSSEECNESKECNESEECNQSIVPKENFLTDKYFRSLGGRMTSSTDGLPLDEAIRLTNLRLSNQEEKYMLTTSDIQQSAQMLMSLQTCLNEMESSLESVELEIPSLSKSLIDLSEDDEKTDYEVFHAADNIASATDRALNVIHETRRQVDIIRSSFQPSDDFRLVKPEDYEKREFVYRRGSDVVNTEMENIQIFDEKQNGWNKAKDAKDAEAANDVEQFLKRRPSSGQDKRLLSYEKKIYLASSKVSLMEDKINKLEKSILNLDDTAVLDSILDVEIDVLKLSLEVKDSNKKVIQLHDEVLNCCAD